MIQLQNDLTTPEQSKRLIELGVPKNSANHYYGKDGKLHYIDGTIPFSLLWATGCTPCWSVGRLQEIFDICYTGEPFQMWCDSGFYLSDNIIEGMELRINEMDFSKLED